MNEPTRRWDLDERGTGIASGEPFGEGLDALREHMRAPGWVTEDADAHLLPHIRRACETGGYFDVLGERQDEDGVYVVRLTWRGERDLGSMREAVFALVGAFAESSTHVRQRTLPDGVEYDVVTGMLPDETPFRTHGHLVRFRIEGAQAARAAV
jgi:hypothetical protein